MEDWLDWYRSLAWAVRGEILPDFRQLDEARMLAGWSDRVMQRAAEAYVMNYRNQQVSAPVALFRKLAAQAASGLAAPAGRQESKYQQDYRRRRSAQ